MGVGVARGIARQSTGGIVNENTTQIGVQIPYHINKKIRGLAPERGDFTRIVRETLVAAFEKGRYVATREEWGAVSENGMKQFSIYVDPELHDKISTAAKAQGVSMSLIVRSVLMDRFE